MEHLADIKPKILSLLGDNRHSRRILIGNEPAPMLDADYAFVGRHNEDDVFPTRDTVCVLSCPSRVTGRLVGQPTKPVGRIITISAA
jgi:hypothetical protein